MSSSSGRNYSGHSYPGNRRTATPSAPPLSPPARDSPPGSSRRVHQPLSPLDINHPPIEDVYEQEERDAELARRLQVRTCMIENEQCDLTKIRFDLI